MRDVLVSGVGITPFAKPAAAAPFWAVGSAAVAQALDDAGFELGEVQSVFCGGVYTDIADGHRIMAELGLTGVPIVNVENACSSGTSAFRLAYQSVATDLCDVALACGTDVVPQRGFLPGQAWPEWERAMGFNVQPANYALKTVRYLAETGVTMRDVSAVTVKNRRNGTLNDNALFRTAVSIEEVLASRMVATPLRLLHCSALAAGGAAVVLSSARRAKSARRAPKVVASVLNSGTYGVYTTYGDSVRIRNPSHVELSAREAWDASGLGPEDVDLAQVYDTTASAELWCLEYLGFCGKGEAVGLLRDGVFDLGGRLPVNTDGGLMARGHPMGATGLAQIVEIVRQLRGEAGPRQVPAARVGLAQNMGAGPNSSISILKW